MTPLPTNAPRHARRLSLLLAGSLLIAACGSAAADQATGEPSVSASEPSSTSPAPTDGSAPDSTPASTSDTSISATDPAQTEDSTGTTGTSEAPTVTAEGPAVPAMTLQLDDGSSIELANTERPVMLVFWAEW